MTTTDLYSGFDPSAKNSSRVLNPPGGKSSNIFGTDEPAQPQIREQPAPRQQVTDQNQNSGVTSQQSPANPTLQAADVKKKAQGEAPFASFQESGKPSNPTQFDKCDSGSQNEADFRCYSVTAYRDAVQQNQNVRQRARGQASSGFNPITHEETNSSPFADYEQTRNPQAARDRPNQKRSGKMQQDQSKAAAKFNPITGEEYPQDYGTKKDEENKEEEEESTENKEKTENTSTNTTPPADPNEPHLGAPKKTAVKVRQPPGGASSGLW